MRRTRLQLRVLQSVLAVVPVVTTLALLDPHNTVFSIAVVWVPMTCAVLAAIAAVRRGWIDLSGWMISAALWLFVTSSLVFFGGIGGNNGTGYFIVVMVASTALGARPALFLAALASLAAGLVALAEWRGQLPAAIVAPTLFNGWIALAVTLVLATFLHVLSVRSLDELLANTAAALKLLRETQRENEARGLQGAALSELAKQALVDPDSRTFSIEAGSVIVSLLAVDRVFLLEIDPQLRASMQSLLEASPPSIQVSCAGTALAESPGRPLDATEATVAAVLERLGSERLAAGFLAPVSSRSGAMSYLGVGAHEPRSFTRAEQQFLSTMASIIGSLRERELASERAQRAQKMELVGRLAGSVAHDFNNLLTVIIGSSHILREETQAGERAALLDEIDGATSSARLLTQQLLSFSRKRVISMTRLDLAAQLRESLPMLRRLLGDNFVIEDRLPDTPCFVDGDRGGFDQIVLNLLVNAREAMSDGGTIEVSLEGREDGVRLHVRDSGVGMDEGTRTLVFQPFFTTKAHGTGLGLATVADIAQRHGATIDIESELGKGTTFTVCFPRSVAEAAMAGRTVGASATLRGRVLLAEDHPNVRANTSRMLRTLGLQVEAVESGVEAAQRLLSGEVFDLLVTDVTMPGMGGPELASQLAKQGVRIPILFISGYVETIPKSPLGVSRFLPKPFTRDELFLAVSGLLG